MCSERAPEGDVLTLTFAVGPDGNLAQAPSVVVLPDAAPGVSGLTPPQAMSRLAAVAAARADDAGKAHGARGRARRGPRGCRSAAGRARPAGAAAAAAAGRPRPTWGGSEQERRANAAKTAARRQAHEAALASWQAQVDQLNATVPRPPTPPSTRVAPLVDAYVLAGRSAVPERQAVEDRLTDVDIRVLGLVTDLEEKQAAMAAADVEIGALRGRIGGRTATWLPLLAVDPRGLTVNGARCSFFPTDSRPFLVESALGRVGLYGRGRGGEAAYAQFETVTSRPSTALPGSGGGLSLMVRSPRLLARPGRSSASTSSARAGRRAT